MNPHLLSWNSARLLALILNALGGLFDYYNKVNDLSLDEFFTLSLVNAQLNELLINANSSGYHKDIYGAIKNLTNGLHNRLSKINDEQRRYVDDIPVVLNVTNYRKVDERSRWKDKSLLIKLNDTSWFRNNFTSNCLIKLTSSCDIDNDCSNLLQITGTSSYALANQVLYLTVAKIMGCSDTMKRLSPQKLNDHKTSLCTNMLDEIRKFQRDKKKLARIEWRQLELLFEQVFACGLNGYVEFSDPHILVAALAWQHPEIGCYTRVKPEAPNLGILSDISPKMKTNRNKFQQGSEKDACLPHLTVVATGTLLVFLNFLMNPSPWPEYHLSDKLMTVDQIVAEDRFRSFHYVEWVKDAHFPSNVRLPKPPPMAWSPDLIAFMVLLFIVVIVSIVAHHLCSSNNRYWTGKGHKRMYPFAYKKL